MDATEIIAEFLKIRNKSYSSTNYFLIQGNAGVGKTTLLRSIQELVKKDGLFSIYINSEIETSANKLWSSLVRQILENGYKETCYPKLLEFENRFNDNNSNIDRILSNTEFNDLPLFTTERRPTKHINESPDYLKTNINELLFNVFSEIISRQQLVFIVDSSVINTDIEKMLSILVRDLSPDLLIIIACRRVLPILWPKDWEIYQSFILEPYNEEKTNEFLLSNGYLCDSLLTDIHHITGGYVQYLVKSVQYWNRHQSKVPKIDRRYIKYIISEIINCNFREINLTNMQQLAKLASLCRALTFDSVKIASPNKLKENEYRLLLSYSFIYNDPIGTRMLPILQQALIREWREELPNQLISVYNKQLKYYQRQTKNTYSQDISQSQIYVLYYQLCIDEKSARTYPQELIAVAESRYDLKFLRLILEELIDFPFKGDKKNSLLFYWRAMLAQTYNNWTEAEKCYRVLLGEQESILRGYGHYGLGQILRIKGNWDVADSHLIEAANIFAATSNEQLRFNSLVLRANILFRRHKWLDAARILNKAQEYAEKAKNDYWHFQIKLNFGKLFRSQGDWKQAVVYLLNSLEIAYKLENMNFEANVYFELGKLYRSQENWNESIINFDKCLNLRRRLGDILGEAECLHSLGTVYFRNGDLDIAKQYFSESLKIKEKIDDKYGIAKSIGGLGHIARLSGDFDAAIAHYLQAVELFETTQNNTKASRVLCRLGMTYAEQGLLDKARESLNQSKLLRSQGDDKQGIAESLYELGRMEEYQGDSKEATESFLLSAKLARESLSIGREIPSLIAATRTLIKLHSYTSAFQYAQEIRLLVKSAQRYNTMAEEYWSWGSLDFEKDLYDVAFFSFAESIDATVLGGLDKYQYCREMINKLEQVASNSGIVEADNLSKKVITQWEILSDADSPIRLFIATELHRSGSSRRDFSQLKKICDSFSITN